MLKFYAEGFVDATANLADLRGAYDILQKKYGLLRDGPVPPPQFEQKVRWLHQTLTSLGLIQSAEITSWLLHHIEGQTVVDNDRLRELINQSINAMIVELTSRVVLLVPENRKVEYKRDGTFLGKQNIWAFGALGEDATEAGNCFALGRFTACVFHLMRVIEKCLQELANSLQMSLTLTWDREWQLVINDIRGQLKVSYPSHKDPSRIKYETILGHLETVKIAWRNTTMHPKKTYTDEEAKEIMDAIRAFVNSLRELLHP